MAQKKKSRKEKKQDQVINLEDARQERRKRKKQASQMQRRKKKAPKSKRRATKVAFRRLIYVGIVGALVIVVAVAVYHLFSLHRAVDEEKNRQKALEAEKAKLENELEQVNSDAYVEDKARGELHMVKPGEVIYVVSGAGVKTTDQAIDKKKDNAKK